MRCGGVAASVRTPCAPSHQRTHIANAKAHPPRPPQSHAHTMAQQRNAITRMAAKGTQIDSPQPHIPSTPPNANTHLCSLPRQPTQRMYELNASTTDVRQYCPQTLSCIYSRMNRWYISLRPVAIQAKAIGLSILAMPTCTQSKILCINRCKRYSDRFSSASYPIHAPECQHTPMHSA